MRILYDGKETLVESKSTFRAFFRELRQGDSQVTILIFTSNDRVVLVRDLDTSFASYGLGPGSMVAAKDKESSEARMLGGMFKKSLSKRLSRGDATAHESQIPGNEDLQAAEPPQISGTDQLLEGDLGEVARLNSEAEMYPRRPLQLGAQETQAAVPSHPASSLESNLLRPGGETEGPAPNTLLQALQKWNEEHPDKVRYPCHA